MNDASHRERRRAAPKSNDPDPIRDAADGPFRTPGTMREHEFGVNRF